MELSDEELMNIVRSMETPPSPHTPPLFDDGGLDDMELMSAVINIESPSSPLLTENDELSDSIETAVITGEIGQLSWQDVFDFFNEPILISDSEEEDNVDVVSISSDSDIIEEASSLDISDDSIGEASSVDIDSFSDVEALD